MKSNATARKKEETPVSHVIASLANKLAATTAVSKYLAKSKSTVASFSRRLVSFMRCDDGTTEPQAQGRRCTPLIKVQQADFHMAKMRRLDGTVLGIEL